MTTAVGSANPFSDSSEYNLLQFVIGQALAKMQTVTVCKVVNVDTTALTVDVQVLVNLMTGNRQPVPHGVIYARPYYRLQGGANGIICDPAPGDIGILVFGSRDLTAVIAAKGQANPGSQRIFDWADGLYFGGLLNATPTQYIQFVPDSGITIQGANEPTGTGGGVNIYGGSNGTGGQGGSIVIEAGEGDVSSGSVLISAAGGFTPNPGDVFILTDTTLTLFSNGALSVVIGGSSGTAGQPLVADGAGDTQWGTGFTGTFATGDSRTATVVSGLIVSVV